MGLPFALAPAARANRLKLAFNIPAPGAPPTGAAPWATLSLNLNANDTISGQLNLTQGLTTSTFCFNVTGSNARFEITGLPSGWYGKDTGSLFGCGATSFGTFNSYLNGSEGLTSSNVTFTLHRKAGFSSVYNLVELSLFGQPRVDFATDVLSGSTFGLAGAVAPTPELPSSVLLVTALFVSLLGKGSASRHRQAEHAAVLYIPSLHIIARRTFRNGQPHDMVVPVRS